MTLIIKKANINNLKDIQNLNLMLFEKEYKEFDNTLDCKWSKSKESKKYFTKRITDNDGCAYVAYDDDKLVGYLVGGLSEMSSYRTPTKFAELENMFILNEHRGHGIGTELYNKFLKWCKSKKIKKIRVIASAQNMNTIKFYKKNGFFEYDLILEQNI
jgi:ribosomal protein S18 acetylase RimI-like enzyme